MPTGRGKQLTKLSLFSGILGDDLASEWAGIKTVCCVEIDPFCQAVIKKHYPDMPIIGDIHDVTKEKLREVIKNSASANGGSSCGDLIYQRRVASQDRGTGISENTKGQDGIAISNNKSTDTNGCAEGDNGYPTIDIIAGGDPCQPRSIAGKRRGREDDRDLWEDMFRVVCELKPTWVVNENPTGRLTMDFHEVLSDLESAGYETRSFVIPACAVNAPHRRDRVYVIAHNGSIGAKQGHSTARGLFSVNRGDSVITPDPRLQRPQEPEQQTVGSEEHCSLIADPDSRWEQQSQGSIEESRRRIENSPRPNVTHAQEQGLEGAISEGAVSGRGLSPEYYPVSGWAENWIEVATALCGVDDGISHRVARLKALGNAQVPQQVYPIYKAIVEIEAVLNG